MSSALGDTHFEVFEKINRKASWRLVEARDTKASALELAAERIKKAPGASIRVTKEKWIEADGAFRSYTIFEAGEKFEDDDRADRTTEIPCRTPGDLAKAMARETIGRVLGDWLSRNKATPLELLHRVDLVEKLEASGTEYQHAIQKVAIARASSADANVQNIIKQLNALLQRTIEQLYESHRAGVFVAVKPGRFADAVDAATGAGAQKLRGAIALHLKDADRWTAKLDAILTLAEETRGMDKAQRALAINVLGEYAVDILEIEAARGALIDSDCDTGDALDAYTDIILGKEHPRASDIGKRLAGAFASGLFRDAQCVIAGRILGGLTAPKRLKPGDIRAEIKLNRSIADRLILVAGRLVSQEALVEAFVYRSGRLLGEDAIESLLDHAAGHIEALAALVELEDNIVGDANKSKLAGLIRARLVHMPVETHFLRGRGSPTSRLAELASLRRDLDAASFAAQDHAEIGEIIDRYATAIENEAKLFDQIVRRSASALEAAATLLKLVDGGVAPAGRLAEAARTRAKELLGSEDAKAELRSGDPARRALAEELTGRLAGDASAAA